MELVGAEKTAEERGKDRTKRRERTIQTSCQRKEAEKLYPGCCQCGLDKLAPPQRESFITGLLLCALNSEATAGGAGWPV